MYVRLTVPFRANSLSLNLAMSMAMTWNQAQPRLSKYYNYLARDYLSNSVVTASIVIGGIFLSSDQLLRVK